MSGLNIAQTRGGVNLLPHSIWNLLLHILHHHCVLLSFSFPNVTIYTLPGLTLSGSYGLLTVTFSLPGDTLKGFSGGAGGMMASEPRGGEKPGAEVIYSHSSSNWPPREAVMRYLGVKCIPIPLLIFRRGGGHEVPGGRDVFSREWGRDDGEGAGIK
jgi:hypothetical protein